jgi:hypothetical protein
MEGATKCTHIPYLPLSFNVFKLECLSKMIPRLKHGTKLLLNTCGVRRKLTSGAGAFKLWIPTITYNHRNPDLRALEASFKTPPPVSAPVKQTTPK